MTYNSFRPPRTHAASAVAYTVYRTESIFDNAGTLKATNQYVEAVCSDSSCMRRASTREVQDRKIQFSNGNFVKINDLAGKKSTYPGVYSGLPPQRDPDASHTNTQETTQGWVISGQETIGGHPTVRLVRPRCTHLHACGTPWILARYYRRISNTNPE